MKTNRQDEILRIIATKEIETQEDLAGELRALGYRVTQATVSRDIKDLHLVKTPGEHSIYKYAKPVKQETALHERLFRILTDSMISVMHSGQMIVVKTLSGSANAAAEAIDMMEYPEVLGTIAGDNTIFIVVREDCDAAELSTRIRNMSMHR